MITTYPWETEPEDRHHEDTPTVAEEFVERFAINPDDFPVGVTEEEIEDWLFEHAYTTIVAEYRSAGHDVVLYPHHTAARTIEGATPDIWHYITSVHHEQGE